MYHAPVPTLIIRADAACLILINGRVAGECAADSYIAVPVSENGDYYITAQPIAKWLDKSTLSGPVSARLSFEKAQLISQSPDSAKICLWPNGVFEITLLVQRLMPMDKPCPARLIDAISPSISGTRYDIALYGQGSYSSGLYIYRANAQPVCLDTGYAEDGMLGMFQLFGADYLSVRLSGAYGERLMLIDKDIKIALDITASQCYIESSAPVAIESLNTLRCHQRRTRYSYADGAFEAEEPQTGFFTQAQPYMPKNRLERAIAFLEANMLSLEEEAMSYLAPELAQTLPANALKEFLGGYSSVSPPAGDSSGNVIGLISKRRDGLCSARLYSFEHGENGIDNITEL